MTKVTEPETMHELIADCAELPNALTPTSAVPPPPRAPTWDVDDRCCAQIADLDEYV
ncbi:hypothetical protein [Haloechinothrix alba]|uniref:hypothetical protein n=1 Tax=Haloechinothrix alba TaxID=664784 RepID=UPI0015954277|nr:hypothetical protein [Haloechinothrix alba]